MNLKSKLQPRFQKYASFGAIPKLFFAPIALTVVALVILLRPFIIIKFQNFKFPFGHYILETEMVRLRTHNFNRENLRKKLVIFIFPKNTKMNSFANSLWIRNLIVISGDIGWLINELARKFKFTDLKSHSSPIDFLGLLTTRSDPPKFSPSEIKTGREFLRDICPHKKFICLNVRDGSFHQELGEKESRQNHRNSDISSYVKAAEALSDFGYAVFRMGAQVERSIPTTSEFIFDYATNGMRTDFLDFFLGAHCEFSISTGSGWDNIPIIFRRPVLYINFLPVFAPSALALPLLIYFKQIFDQTSQSQIDLKGIIERDIQASHNFFDYQNSDLKIKDLSSTELVEAFIEMAQRVEGTFVETPEQKVIQAKLKHVLSTHPKLQPTPNYYPIRAQFASCFFKNNPHFLD